MKKLRIRKARRKELIIGLLFILTICVVFGGYQLYQYIKLRNAVVMVEQPKQDSAIFYGDTYQINAQAKDKDYSDRIVYKIKDEKIAKVNKNGLIEGLMPGLADVEIYVDGSTKKEKISLKIKEHIFKIKDPERNKLRATYSYQMNAFDETIKQDAKNVTWTSSNNDIATISKEGKIKCLKAGKTTISIEANGNKVGTMELNIKNKEPKKIYAKKSISLTIKENKSVKSLSLPSSIQGTQLTYSTKNKAIATIKNNRLTPLKAGKTELEIFSEEKDIKYIYKINITNPYLTQGKYLSNQKLDSLGAKSANKLMIVAHPDDETLWGGGHLSQGGWFVVCLTNGNNSIRSSEYKRVLSSLGARGAILSYPDSNHGVRNNWSTVQSDIQKDIRVALGYKNWKMVTTHNPQGEYGHIHHKKTNKYTKALSKEFNLMNKLYYFGKYHKAIPSSLTTNLSASSLNRKQNAINLYASQMQKINLNWSQMIPHEHWTKA